SLTTGLRRKLYSYLFPRSLYCLWISAPHESSPPTPICPRSMFRLTRSRGLTSFVCVFALFASFLYIDNFPFGDSKSSWILFSAAKQNNGFPLTSIPVPLSSVS